MVCKTFSMLLMFKIHNWDSRGKILELQMSIKYNKCTNMKGEFYQPYLEKTTDKNSNQNTVY